MKRQSGFRLPTARFAVVRALGVVAFAAAMPVTVAMIAMPVLAFALAMVAAAMMAFAAMFPLVTFTVMPTRSG